ncbi:MAG: hypothetical protein JO210_00670, partial [Acidobacteriaceae bacterium]|nr:hypothetical protein [Acidobacteriaceae bacterium]
TVLSSRGKHLLQGIADILQQVDPTMKREIAERIARSVLSHPLIADGTGRLGSVIHREELTKLLLELASSDGPQALDPDLKNALQTALVKTGICQPGTTAEIDAQIKEIIKNFGSLALQLELLHPELTNNERARIAILKEANSPFLAKINLWFDQTIDRVSDRFTLYTRYITFTAGLLLALVIQLDTAALVSRLASDDAVRNSLIAQMKAQQPEVQKFKLTDAEVQNIHDLMTNNLVGVPTSWSDWRNRWSMDNAVMKAIGILLSAVLLSLGAPFWYNALQNLIRLRSLLAFKDDQQRRERQLSLPAAAATSVAAVASDERT